MSKIQAELMEVCEISERAVKGKDRQEVLKLILKGTNELSDKEFNELSDEAADWCNAAADAINAKAKNLPDFPDAEPAAEEETGGRRRRSAAKEEAPADEAPTGTEEIDDAAEGDMIRLVTKRGTDVTGTVVEIDDEIIVLKMPDGEEKEYDRKRVDKMYGLPKEKKGRRSKAEEEPEDDPIKVGAEVKVVTKRGKEATGKIVEIDEEIVVIDDGKEEVEFERGRVESITPVKAAKGKDSGEEPSGRRRGAAKSSKEEAPDEGKRTRSSNEGGVSVGTRIKELLADDPEMSMEAIGKQLEKEGIAFRENTLQLNYKDCMKFLEVLKKAKRLK